jgi:hypothetical protein
LSDEDVHKGYAVDFLSLTMHAISRDEDAYPQPCIYSQIDGGEDEDEEYEEDGTDDGAEELLESENHGSVGDFSHVTEMRLVPRDASSCILHSPFKPLSLSALKALVPIEDLLTSCLSSLFEDGVELLNFVACVHYLSLSSFSEAYVYYLFHIQLFPNVIVFGLGCML